MLKKKFFKTNDDCEVTFEFAAPEANDVALYGEFTEWEPVAMKKAKAKNAAFKFKTRLPKDGQFQFRYLIDNQIWENDEAADAYWVNDQGSENSVVITSQN
jgi:1,4-alpha-glucan branching enzyme